MAFRPLGDRVLLKMNEAETISKGGIHLAPSAQEKPQEATVIAVGSGRVTEKGQLIEPRVKKHDVVLISKYVGTEIKLDGVPHTIVTEDDILGIVEKD